MKPGARRSPAQRGPDQRGACAGLMLLAWDSSDLEVEERLGRSVDRGWSGFLRAPVVPV